MNFYNVQIKATAELAEEIQKELQEEDPSPEVAKAIFDVKDKDRDKTDCVESQYHNTDDRIDHVESEDRDPSGT